MVIEFLFWIFLRKVMMITSSTLSDTVNMCHNFQSNHSSKMTINYIFVLKERVIRLIHLSFHILLLIQLRDILFKNSYPKSLVNKSFFSTPLSASNGVLAIHNAPDLEVRDEEHPTINNLFCSIP